MEAVKAVTKGAMAGPLLLCPRPGEQIHRLLVRRRTVEKSLPKVTHCLRRSVSMMEGDKNEAKTPERRTAKASPPRAPSSSILITATPRPSSSIWYPSPLVLTLRMKTTKTLGTVREARMAGRSWREFCKPSFSRSALFVPVSSLG